MSFKWRYCILVPVYVPSSRSCYCTPAYFQFATYGTPASNYSFNRIRLSTAGALFNDGFAPARAGYLDRSRIASSIILARGGSYLATLNYVNTSGYYQNQAWIDYNDDGIFSATEAVTPVVGLGSCSTATNIDTFGYNVSLVAPLGFHMMRIRNVWSNNSCYESSYIFPCGMSDSTKNYLYGNTVDYLVKIINPVACSGTPAAGVTTANAGTVCSGTTITFGLRGTSANGITFQWQSSTDSVSWSNVAGATNPVWTSTLSATAHYRCRVTCTSSGLSSFSVPVFIPYSSACYCTPTYYQYVTYGYPAHNNSINSFGMNTGSGAFFDGFAPAVAGYVDRTTLNPTINLYRGATYTGTVTYVNNNNYYQNQVWIDYNDDGVFAASEAITPVFGMGSCSTATNVDTFACTISITAPTGIHRMRVRNVLSYTNCYPSVAMDPCNSSDAYKVYHYGGTVDYLVKIFPAPACTTTPPAGVAISATGSMCAGTPVSLTLTGVTVSGVSYQWQRSINGSTYTNIVGATNTTYSDTTSTSYFYINRVTCVARALSANSVSVFVPYSRSCYCAPSYYNYITFGTSAALQSINKVSLNGSSSSINDVFAPSPNGYLDRTAAFSPITFNQGGTYTGSVTYINTNYYYQNQAWIDYNDDGTFAASESITPVFGSATCSLTASSDSFVVNIPLNATVGVHRMRIRNAYASSGCYLSTVMSPCAQNDGSKTYYYGNAIDYMVRISAAPACTGTPAAGITTTSAGTACPSAGVTLSVVGASASGIAYQWQRSTDSTTWNNITGATNAVYTGTFTATFYYRCRLTCTSSTLFDYSVPVLIPYSSACYCTPAYANYVASGIPASNYAFNRFSLSGSGVALNDVFAPISNGYLDRTTVVSTINLARGATYTGTVTYVNTHSYYQNQAWIDFNDDGTFAASEAVTRVFGLGDCSLSTNTDTFSLTIPLTATSGLHRMRVRNVFSTTSCYNSTSMNPCGQSDGSKYYHYGNTADYMVRIGNAAGCSGTPSGATTISSTSAACPGTSVSLNLVGVAATGINYQWQFSADSVSWTNITGATAAAYTSTVSATNYYRNRLTCVSSGLSANSIPVRVAYSTGCYCTPSYYQYITYGSSASNNALNRITMNGAGMVFNDAFAPAIAGYLDRTGTAGVLNVSQGGSYTAIIGYHNTQTYYQNQIWIDYNDDGTFATSEAITPVVGVSSCSTPVNADTFTYSVSLTAPLGLHRMRVRNAWSNTTCNNSPAMNPCGLSDGVKTYNYGNTVDYLVKIVTPPACSGTPTGGTAVTSTPSACTGTLVALSLTGTSASGMSYQWQFSSDSSSWSNISGATAASYSGTISATNYYRCRLTCISSGAAANSSGVRIAFSSSCYCTPTYYQYTTFGTPASNNAINRFRISGTGASVNDPFTPATAGYLDRSDSVGTISLTQGATYRVTVNYSTTSSYYENQIWIDYNNDNVFATSEAVTPVFGLGTCASTTNTDTLAFNISLTAAAGVHRMRVRNAWSNTSCYLSPAMNACGQSDGAKTYNYGNTVDYNIQIVAPSACSGTPTGGITVTGAGTTCPGTLASLSLTGVSATGLSFQWQRSADSSTWNNISGATSSTWIDTPLATYYYRCRITCVSSGLSSNSAPAYVPYSGTCYCTPTYTNFVSSGTPASNYAITRLALNGAGVSFSDPFSPVAAGYLDRTTAAPTVVLSQGARYSGTVNYVNSQAYYENQIWIDYDNDGNFAASEAITPVFGLGICSGTVSSDTFSANVAINAPVGYHRMRVRNVWSNTSCFLSPDMNPCGQADGSKIYFYGNTVDYMVRIAAPAACSGTPAGGTTVSANGNVCPGTPVSLSLTGVSATGITYQWQRSADSTTWTSISGATNATYSDTASATFYYRCRVTCVSSGLAATSTPVYVLYSNACYCYPSYYQFLVYGIPSRDYSVNRIKINGAGSVINDAFAPANAGYLDRTAVTPTLTVNQGGTYTASLSYVNTSGYYQNQIWIDYDNDGNFATSEAVTGVMGAGNCSFSTNSDTFSLNIPLTATTGVHRMRVRNA